MIVCTSSLSGTQLRSQGLYLNLAGTELRIKRLPEIQVNPLAPPLRGFLLFVEAALVIFRLTVKAVSVVF